MGNDGIDRWVYLASSVIHHSLFIVCLVPDFHTWSDGPDLLAHQMAVMHVH